MVDVSLVAAFIAGIISFLSPCVLPILPGFVGYLSGTAAEGRATRSRLFLSTVFFVLGFSLVFALLGVLLLTALEGASYTIQTWLSRIGGAIIIFFGLYILGVFKLPFLMRERRFHFKPFKNPYLSSFVFGSAFAVGWTPCVGAILGSILALAVSQPSLAFSLLLTYSLGLSLPFLLVGIFSTEALRILRKSGKILKYYNIVVGILIIILGVLVFTQTLNIVANFSFLNEAVLG